MGHGEDIVSTRTGLAKHFDTMTIIGRRNCTLGTYSFFFACYIIYKLTGSKKEKA